MAKQPDRDRYDDELEQLIRAAWHARARKNASTDPAETPQLLAEAQSAQEAVRDFIKAHPYPDPL